jgi:hypothetical protein
VDSSELLVGYLAARHDPDTVAAVLPVSLCGVAAER